MKLYVKLIIVVKLHQCMIGHADGDLHAIDVVRIKTTGHSYVALLVLTHESAADPVFLEP